MTDSGEVRVEALGERPELDPDVFARSLEWSEHYGESEYVPVRGRAFTEAEAGVVGDDFVEVREPGGGVTL